MLYNPYVLRIRRPVFPFVFKVWLDFSVNYMRDIHLRMLELKWLWMLWRSLPEMAQRVSKTELILSSPEPG